MSDFNKEKLFVEVSEDVDNFSICNPRGYMLTHSDETGELFLKVGKEFKFEELPENRDEVMAQWRKIANKSFLRIDLHIDGKDKNNSRKRDNIFRTELPLALRALVEGDKRFIYNNGLGDASIVVYFNSSYDEYNKIERWGVINDYLSNDYREESNRVVQIGEKDRVILTLLTPFIEKELNKLYGRKQFFCPNFSRVLSIRPLSPPFACRGSFSVTVGLRVGFNPPKFNQQGFNQNEANSWSYDEGGFNQQGFNQKGFNNPGFNNVIIEFIVRPEGVRTQSVKNPR